ncbi:MAG: group 1 truncated hemoglobin [Dokdonella sp.]
MITFHTKLGVMAMAASLLLAGMPDSASSAENPAPADPSLLPVFHQFGDKAGLVALMEDFMTELVADPRTRPFFADSDQKHIKAELVDQFCVILGGPCQYTGKSMSEVHAKFAIHESEFNALVEDLQVAMDKHSIPFRAQNKLLERLAPMHRQVITRP